jgi:predicted permease
LCIAQVLLIGAGLLLRSSQMIRAVPPGFDTHNLLAASVSLPRARYRDPKMFVPTFDRIAAALAAVPGVKSVGYAQVTPIYGRGWNWAAFREGSNGHDEGTAAADMRGVSPSYFSALGLRLIRGRAFTTADGSDSPPVAIISRGLAVRLFGTADVVGKRISNGPSDKPIWKEIVGVADDVHGNGLRDDPFPALYMPAAQFNNPVTTFVIRGNLPVTTLVPQLRRAVASVDPLLPLAGVQTFEEAIGRSLAVPRFNTWLLGLLGFAGLVLAIVGVYGVISYFVTQRSHEIGVRVALGASSSSVQRLIVRQGLALAAVGISIGTPLALLASRLLRSFIFGISEHDPLTYAGVAVVLAGVALAASYVPARRATRIDPLEALRST